MSCKIEGKGFTRALEILLERTEPSDIIITIIDLDIRNPGISDDLDRQDWFLKLLERLNKNLQLPKLFEAMSKKFEEDNPGDPDAGELRKIVEKARAANARPDLEPARPAQTVDSRSTPAQAARSPKLDRIILLGESTAISATPVADARRALHAQLTQDFKDKKVSISDWGDSWKTVGAPAAQADDAKALFVRVINMDILNDNLPSLISLPKRLGEKLKLTGPVDPAQIVIWNCDGAAQAPQNGDGIPLSPDAGRQEPDDSEIKAQLRQQMIALSEHAITDFAKVVRSRLRLGKWPPVLRLEHPGDNKFIEDKLINVIKSRTMEKCDPADPQMLYWEVTSTDSDQLISELKDLLTDEVSRDGLIIAIHDLNLGMTDDRNEALWAFQDRLREYDGLIASVVKDISKEKVIKLAVIMASANKLIQGKYPYEHLNRDWIIVGMKMVGATAVLTPVDEGKIQKRIDQLLGAN